MQGNGPSCLLSGFSPTGGAVSFTHAARPCSQTYWLYIKHCHQQLSRPPGSKTTHMTHQWLPEPGHQSGWSCWVWKSATELKVTFAIRQTALRRSIKTAVSPLYFMTLLILRVLFYGCSRRETVVKQVTEWILTVRGNAKYTAVAFRHGVGI